LKVIKESLEIRINAMKVFTSIVTLLFCSLQLCDCKDLADDKLVELEKLILNYHEAIFKRLSEKEVSAFKNCEKFSDFYDLDSSFQKSLDYFKNLGLYDENLGEKFKGIDVLKSGDDVFKVFGVSFLYYVKKERFDLSEIVADIDLYWKEEARPEMKVVPGEEAPIIWAWKLEVDTRPHGRLHVGINSSNRRFVCFELGRSFFYPEGDVLDRIRVEIVQSDLLSGDLVGKGRLERKETPQSPE
jgi:hypothetical protein